MTEEPTKRKRGRPRIHPPPPPKPPPQKDYEKQIRRGNKEYKCFRCWDIIPKRAIHAVHTWRRRGKRRRNRVCWECESLVDNLRLDGHSGEDTPTTQTAWVSKEQEQAAELERLRELLEEGKDGDTDEES